jgi:hypothetical protein
LGLTLCVPAYDEDATEDRTCTYLSASGTRGGVRVHLSTVGLDDDHESRNDRDHDDDHDDDHESRDGDGESRDGDGESRDGDGESRDGDGEYRRRAGS